MRKITETRKVLIKISKDDVINGEWIASTLVSDKLKDMEVESNEPYKSLRNKFYNTDASGRFNTTVIGGVKCINIKKPMNVVPATLEIEFRGTK